MILKDKISLVTGSSSGIGFAIAEAMSAAGASVVLTGSRPQKDLEALAGEIRNKGGGRVIAQSSNLAEEAGAAALAEAALKAFGRVDILVNNAGIQHVAPIGAFPSDKWDLILNLNLTAAFRLTRAFFPRMVENGFGRIINIASAHALVASPFKAAYVAAKHGLLGLTKVVSLEGAEAGITCNAICPGYVMTPLVENQISDQAKAHGIPREQVIENVILAPQPMKRFAEPREIAALAVFLASPNGASITGTALPVDGGWTAR